MMMRVHAIKQDFNDKALTIPTAIIVKQAADFDGDVKPHYKDKHRKQRYIIIVGLKVA